MKIAELDIPEGALSALFKKWKICRLELFGSASRGELGPESDVDLLADFENDEAWSLMDIVQAQDEFAALFGRSVDLVDRANLEHSANPLRRNSILKFTRFLYAA